MDMHIHNVISKVIYLLEKNINLYKMSKDCEACSRVSNNKFSNCPPLMADGRHFTDYRPRCFSQYLVTPNGNFPSSFDYRMYLTRNADGIMKKNALDAYRTNVCGPCVEPYNIGTMLPEKTVQSCNTRTCTFNKNDPNGLGLGRFFGDKDTTRTEFLQQKKAESDFFKSKDNCCAPAIDNLYLYPIDGVTRNNYERYSVPGGGVPFQ